MDTHLWPGSKTDRVLNTVVNSTRMPFVWTATDTKNAFYTSLIPLGTYAAGHLITSGDRHLAQWLESLRKPDWAPRDIPFACSVGDFLTMAPLGYATYKVFQTGGGFDYNDTKVAMALFGSNMLFHLGKSYCLKNRDLKCLHLNKVLLYLTALGAAISYYRIDSQSGYCFIPYCLWTLFGSILSYNLWKSNGDKSHE